MPQHPSSLLLISQVKQSRLVEEAAILILGLQTSLVLTPSKLSQSLLVKKNQLLKLKEVRSNKMKQNNHSKLSNNKRLKDHKLPQEESNVKYQISFHGFQRNNRYSRLPMLYQRTITVKSQTRLESRLLNNFQCRVSRLESLVLSRPVWHKKSL